VRREHVVLLTDWTNPSFHAEINLAKRVQDAFAVGVRALNWRIFHGLNLFKGLERGVKARDWKRDSSGSNLGIR
jgi:hypothetical protein